MEVEKGAPQLKVTVRVDNRDWRTHLEQMHSYRTGIEEALTTTKVQLDKLHSDIARTLEKIGSREKYLNSQLEGGFVHYKLIHEIILLLQSNLKKKAYLLYIEYVTHNITFAKRILPNSLRSRWESSGS